MTEIGVLYRSHRMRLIYKYIINYINNVMHDLTLLVDDRAWEWIEHNRGDMSPEEFASQLLMIHISDAQAADISARLHGHIIEKLDELERRIEQLNTNLRRKEARIHSR